MSETTQVLTVRSLLCHRHVDMALVCLASLLKFSPTPLQLVIHDDGSLTTEDVERLTTQLPGTKVLSRQEADELVNGLLKNHPYAYEYRQEAPLALKLLDMPLLNKGDLAYCDSDVLFFTPLKVYSIGSIQMSLLSS
ncbi:hypothetical protein HC928_15965 [bacterium]|nr:hypothetical protein [bacterium]